MPEEVKTKLANRKTEIEAEFDSLKASHSALSKQLSENQARQVQLQGAYQEIEKLLTEPKQEPKKVPEKK